MAELALILLAFIVAVIFVHVYHRERLQDVAGPKQSQNLKRLWEYCSFALKRQRWDAAERALLEILKNDHQNTMAYNQLGMIYVRTKRLEDAIACFDIASSIAPSVTSLYNLGLVHFQVGNFEEAASSLEKVVDLEPTPKRLLVYARVMQHLGNHKKVAEVVRKAVNLEPNERNLTYLIESYETIKQYKKAEETRERLKQVRSSAQQQFYPDNMRTES